MQYNPIVSGVESSSGDGSSSGSGLNTTASAAQTQVELLKAVLIELKVINRHNEYLNEIKFTKQDTK